MFKGGFSLKIIVLIIRYITIIVFYIFISSTLNAKTSKIFSSENNWQEKTINLYFEDEIDLKNVRIEIKNKKLNCFFKSTGYDCGSSTLLQNIPMSYKIKFFEKENNVKYIEIRW
jgi:hypothetical protein